MKAKLYLFCLLVFSCGQVSTDKETTDKNKRSNFIAELEREYNAKIFNESGHEFTYQFQDIIKNGSKRIIDNFTITDIIRQKDQGYLITIEKGDSYTKKVAFNLFCNDDQKDELEILLKRKGNLLGPHKDIFLISRLYNVEKLKYTIFVDTDDENNSHKIDLDMSTTFLFTGGLLYTFTNNDKL